MIGERKNDHVKNADAQYSIHRTDFDDVHFVHYSLGRKNTDDVDLSTTYLEHHLSSPFFINGMTGGSEWTKIINEKLATVAHETGLAMASGSVSAALKEPSIIDSFKVIRKVNPDGFVMANIGLDHTAEDAKRAIEILDADALEIHLNTPQEIVMPEGDRDFTAYPEHLQAMIDEIDVPIIVKEVGFGMSRELFNDLYAMGVRNFDVSGSGGTNFAKIENARRSHQEMDYMDEWGQSTVISLLESGVLPDDANVIASGGVKNALHIAKSLSLGASAVGLSGQFLHSVLHDGVEETINMVHAFNEQLKLIAVTLNAESIADLQSTDLVILGKVAEWCERRGIPIDHFANRS
ncbi:MAG: type 2 isopentenyl-diphosphate Delta-isomerase [Aerococcus sp.]|nr:type 2 isopentenyl-diphosphate Delta-isomerase [Aerococcus sp.]